MNTVALAALEGGGPSQACQHELGELNSQLLANPDDKKAVFKNWRGGVGGNCSAIAACQEKPGSECVECCSGTQSAFQCALACESRESGGRFNN
jgi:hypothetical protein